MKARVWDLDARFHGVLYEVPGNFLRLLAHDPKYPTPFGSETAIIERRCFTVVEVRLKFAGRYRTCFRWVDPTLRGQFDAHLKALDEHRTPNTRAGYLRALARADRALFGPKGGK